MYVCFGISFEYLNFESKVQCNDLKATDNNEWENEAVVCVEATAIYVDGFSKCIKSSQPYNNAHEYLI